MEHFVTVFAPAAVLFGAFILNLAAQPKLVSRLTAIAFVVTGVGGLVCYSYGYAFTCTNPLLAIIRAALSTAYLFLGKSDFSSISQAPLFTTELGSLLFWLLHIVALYATASAIFITIGAGFLRHLRLLAALRGDLILIYGTHPGALTFGRQMQQRKGCSVVFVDESPSSAAEQAVRTMGCVLRSDTSALHPDRRFLRSLGVRKKRRVWLCALQKESSANTRYADDFRRALAQAAIPPQQTRLTLLGREEGVQSAVLTGDHGGYGAVTFIDEPEMAARILVRRSPPCQALTFDSLGVAQQDLHCLIVGFGHVGQAVLRQVAINGQFLGSTFHAAVFAPDCTSLSGLLSKESAGLLSHYDITFHDCDARSREMYDYLDRQAAAINYVVLCTGDDRRNADIAAELRSYLSRKGRSLPLYLCSNRGVQVLPASGPGHLWSLYGSDILRDDVLDQKARLVHHHYCDNQLTEEENWQQCDYFSRMSSRAAADFAPAFLHISGLSAAHVAREGWDPRDQLLENLAHTEHLRWNAFHYAMGFCAMTPREHLQRAKDYADEKNRTGSSSIKISKDMAGRRHACLVSWDALKSLAEAENAITGEKENYQEKDRKNVRLLASVLMVDETERAQEKGIR